MIDPADFGPVGTPDDTHTVQLAVNAGILYQEPVRIEKFHLVSTVTVADANRFVVEGDGVLRGIGPLPGKTGVLEVLNSVGVKIDGLNVDGANRPDYVQNFKFWSNHSVGAFNCCFFSINCQNGKLGMQFGDAAYPDLAISENVVRHGSFYDIAQGFKIVGSQAVLLIDHFQNITNNAHFPLIEQAGIILEGSTVAVVGGEMMAPSNGNYTGILNKAFNSPLEATYGRAYLTNVAVETPGRLMRTDANGCTGARNGALVVDAHGYVGGDEQHYIELDPHWDGFVDTSQARFRSDAAPPRTKRNVYANPKPGGGVNEKAIIRTGDSFVGTMPKGASGVYGGVYLHDMELVQDARSNVYQTAPGSTWTTLGFAANDVAPIRYKDGFDGIGHTVPACGYKIATATLTVPTNIAVAELEIRVNGVKASGVRIAFSGTLIHTFSRESLNEGDYITAHVNGVSSGGVVVNGARFQITAAA